MITIRQTCAVCESARLETVLDLPGLPLTGRFSRAPWMIRPKGFDQKFLFCPRCQHGQLAFQIHPDELYNNQYYFRTSTSENARRGTAFFLNTLNEFFPQRKFQCAWDVGCNDLFLLKQLKSNVRTRVGIDPIWKVKEHQDAEFSDDGIKVIAQCVETMNWDQHLTVVPDLVIFRHTLEHIYNPKTVLENIFQRASEDAIFAIEVPSLDALLKRLRFDQIFHEHLQYFSWESLRRLIQEIGGTYLGCRENYHDWGAVCVLFTKQKNRAQAASAFETNPETRTPGRIKELYAIFRRQMSVTNEILKSFPGSKLYGYGASNMLPTLAYHLGNDLSCLKSVLDDDSTKDGLYYGNLPLQIKRPESVGNLKDTDIFLTAIDQAQPILKRLLENRPRHIIYPLVII